MNLKCEKFLTFETGGSSYYANVTHRQYVVLSIIQHSKSNCTIIVVINGKWVGIRCSI